MTIKTFSLAAVLSVASGRLLAGNAWDEPVSLMSHIVGWSVLTHQIPGVSKQCADWILRGHKSLREAAKVAKTIPAIDLEVWLAGARAEYGDSFQVRPVGVAFADLS